MNCLRKLSLDETYDVAYYSQSAWKAALALPCTFSSLSSSRSKKVIEELALRDGTIEEMKP